MAPTSPAATPRGRQPRRIRIDKSYHRVYVTALPVFGRTALYAGDNSWIAFDYAILPLSDNGATVNKCLAIHCAGQAEVLRLAVK